MGMTMATPYKEINDYIDGRLSRTLAVIKRKLQRLGLQAVAYVRDRGPEESWYDHTGNLRSSIGYCVVDAGKMSSKGNLNQVAEGHEGVSEGNKYLNKLATEMAVKYPTSTILIIEAGMEYAAYVEAMENKDVLASARHIVEKEIAKMRAGLA